MAKRPKKARRRAPKRTAAPGRKSRRPTGSRAATRARGAAKRSAATAGAARIRAAQKPPAERPPPTGRWLVKTEAGSYGYADLEREGRTVWDGVANALARIHLRAMREGDLVLVYHTGEEKAVAGLARVVAGPRVPPGSEDPAAVVVDFAAVARAASPVPANDLRGEPSCRDLALFSIPRLSVMPVPLDAFAVIARRGGLPGGA
jgi:predicted RNA-binding protein with PUA-like domain